MATTNAGGKNVATQIVKWLSIVGAINWGLVGFFNWDLVRAILGGETQTPASAASRALYAIVGLAGLGLALLAPRPRERSVAAGVNSGAGAFREAEHRV